MTALAWLIPAALALGCLGLAGFLWSLKNRQFEDLDGAAWRVLNGEDGNNTPLSTTPFADGDRDA